MATSSLLSPIRIGNMNLAHRVVMAPLTRYRADENGVHGDIAVEYYRQRTTKGGLQITEATAVSDLAWGLPNSPGVFTDAQVAAWKKVFDAIHEKGGYVFQQIWAVGRAGDPTFVRSRGLPLIGASDIPMPGTWDVATKGERTVTPLTKDQIKQIVKDFGEGAKNSVFGAGADGIELHNANGYLMDQFLQSVSNNRTDEYGGSVESRARFTLEVVQSVVDAVGEERVAIRFSPFGKFQGMRMPDPLETFSYVVEQLRDRFPKLAYIHIVEPRVSGSTDVDNGTDSVEPLRQIYNAKGERPIIVAGGYTPETAEEAVEKHGGAVVFGRYFVSNPDLLYRVKNKLPLAKYDRAFFYDGKGIEAAEGYLDYKTAEAMKA